MAILNKRPDRIFTEEGAIAKHINPELQLRRAVMSCMLFEDTFYESGIKIAERITSLIPQVDAKICGKIAVEAREKAGLRHVPLLIIREMARLPTHRRFVSRLLQRVITRPDQMTDFLALYWETNLSTKMDDYKRGVKKRTLSRKVKDGLARCFVKFNEYQLSKNAHDDRKVKLKDVMFLCHPKPKDAEQESMWKRLIAGELKTVDTWETQLSAGKDKKETFERLMLEDKLGALAFVRNLRNMHEAKCNLSLITKYAEKIDVSKVFPWQFIAAAKFAPWFESVLESCMLRSIVTSCQKKLPGKTILLIDHSGSMDDKLSSKSEMNRLDAACGIAMMLRELSDDCHIYAFSNEISYIPSRHGFALRDAIKNSMPSGGTYLGGALNEVIKQHNYFDRIIVITDEQSRDNIPSMYGRPAYLVNVASNKNGVGYGDWIHIDGFSSHVLQWIKEDESLLCNKL